MPFHYYRRKASSFQLLDLIHEGISAAVQLHAHRDALLTSVHAFSQAWPL